MGEVAKVTMGQSPSSKNYTDNPNDYVLVQGNADLKLNEISPRVWTKEITKQVHKGEIIMTVRAPVGYVAMANMDAVIGRGVAAINGNKYLYYLLQTKLMNRIWKKLSSGSTFESISSNDIKTLEIKVTENKEEKLITKLMDMITCLITLQQRKLKQLKQLKKAMLQQLFVDKNNKQPNLRFKNFKGDWEQHRLEEVAQVTMGQSPSSKNYTDNPNDYVLVQGNADLRSNKISPRVWTREITKQVHKGEIIMTVRAPVGYLAMANMDAVIGRGVAAINGNKYLYYLLQTKLMNRIWEKLSSGSTFESICSNDIKTLEIKVTENEEEKLIAKLMDMPTCLITLQQSKIEQLTILKKYLLQKLFI